LDTQLVTNRLRNHYLALRSYCIAHRSTPGSKCNSSISHLPLALSRRRRIGRCDTIRFLSNRRGFWHTSCVGPGSGDNGVPRSRSSTRRGSDVDAIQMLTDDHSGLKDLFKEYEGAGEDAHQKKRGIVEKVFQELEVHTKLEEEIFYPAHRSKADEEGQDLVRESLEEHHIVDMLMAEMKRLKPDNPEHEAKLKVLMENVKHHAEEEEKVMFLDARTRLRDELDRLGDRMERRKGE